MKTVTGLYESYQVQDSSVNKGGVGAIYPTADPTIVYKEYHSLDKAPPRPALSRLVEIGREVIVARGLSVGATPESSVNWPLDIVPDASGRTKGVILPVIPQSLFNEFGKPRTLEFLVMARAMPPGAQVRVVLLLRMAEILAYLDHQKLVHGDVNGKNLAWSGAPTPIMYLIDCDGIVSQTPPPVAGVQALGWTDPRVLERAVPAHDHFSDWYALALAMYRGLLLVQGQLGKKRPDGTWPKPSKIPPQLDSRVATLLRRALDDPLDASARPSPAEWVRSLVEVYVPNGAYDLAALRTLDRISQPSPTFVTLPPVPAAPTPTPLRPLSPQPPPRYPSYPTPGPPPAPPPGPPSWSRPPPAPAPPMIWQPVAPAAQPAPARSAGWFGEHALRNHIGWHLTTIALSCFCWPVSLVYLLIVTIQVLRAPSWHPGRTRALVFCGCYGALSLFFLILTFGSQLAATSTS